MTGTPITSRALHHTEHTTSVKASPDQVYDLIADTDRWPAIFGPTVHVDQLGRDDGSERLRLWATANGEVRNWVSRRVLDPAARRIVFRQEISTPPVATMSGQWILEPTTTGTRVRLLHDFAVLDEEPQQAAWVQQAVDNNSEAELAALKDTAESAAVFPDTTFSIIDAIDIRGPAHDTYAFLRDAARWADLLPHVSRVDLAEPWPDVQDLTMDSIAPDGSVHTTRSTRICCAPNHIAYKQIQLPPIMAAHVGTWTLHPTASGTRVVSTHTVVVAPQRIGLVLGTASTLADARDLITRSLSTNSMTTLTHAKQAVEAGRH
jgi:aromatase